MVATAVVCIAATAEFAASYLEFDRLAILDGEWWRLLTGHLTHFGWWHLTTNLIYLGALVFLISRLTVRGWLGYTVFAAVVVPLALLAEPESLEQYRGISALLYGLTGWCSLVLAGQGRAYLYGVPILTIIFITLDLLGYSLPRKLPTGVTAYPLAHLYAVVAALLWYFIGRILPVGPVGGWKQAV
ncbi:MAG: rhombosortase [Gammaproteobacteria bacterium]|nr:rhombosortase [Gammaproteobacteria bacterium]